MIYPQKTYIGVDTVRYEPHSTDATKIVLKAGGQFSLPDGTLFRLRSDKTLDINDDLTTDDTLTADTWYYIWCNASTCKFAAAGTTAPSDVTNGVRLRGGVAVYDNAGTSEIIPFIMASGIYVYNVAVELAGSDLTEVFDGAMSTTFLDVDCSAYAPASNAVLVSYYVNFGAYQRWRVNGASHNGIRTGEASSRGEIYEAVLDASGIYEASNSGNAATRISVVGFRL